MKFIKVSAWLQGHRTTLYIAVDKIIDIMPIEGGSCISCIGQEYSLTTDETPEEIFELMEKAGAAHEQ